MNMNKEKLVSLLSELLQESTESEWLEFKHNYHSADEIGERISALANSACLHEKTNAYLVFGIEDKTNVVKGTSFNPKTQKAKGNEDLELWLTTRLNPHIDFRIYSFTFNDKPVVMFDIPSAQNQPISFLHKAYIRVGSHTKELQHYPEKAAKIWKNNISDWSAQICPDATIKDLSVDAIQKARTQFILKNSRLAEESKTWDDITFLNKAKLTINGKITNASLLLLGLPESEHFISPASSRITWILKDAQNFEKDYQHL
jgi:ATP-dependent DNA helicase RecG